MEERCGMDGHYPQNLVNANRRATLFGEGHQPDANEGNAGLA